MARPIKQGLDYFTVDCHFDDKLELVVAEYGMKGLGVLIRLLQKIYSEEGYYCIWNEDVALMFAHKNGLSINTVSEIINACLRRGLFDCGMWQHWGILTSKGIQQRYFSAVSKRKNIKIKNDYLLISVPKNTVNSDENPINDVKNPINDGNNQDTKLDETKLNYTKEDEAIYSIESIKNSKGIKNVNDIISYAKLRLSSYSDDERNNICPNYMVPNNCNLTIAEYDYLVNVVPEVRLTSYINKVGKYELRKHKQFDCIIRWAYQDGVLCNEQIQK